MFFAALAIMLLLLNCSKSDKIVGKWRWQDGSVSQYLENGVVVAEGWNGKYRIDKNILTIDAQPGFLGATAVYEIVELTSKKLVLKKLPDGGIEQGQRID